MRRHRLVTILATVSLISMGIVTLIGLASGPETPPAKFTAFVLRLVAVIGAVAVYVGLLNLIAVHMGRFVRSEHGWPYSLLTLIIAVAVVVLRILDRAEVWPSDLEGEQISLRVFEAVQVSLESALAAVALFSLVYAAYRLMRREITAATLIFAAALLIMLVGWIPLEDIDALSEAREWMVRVPVSAGARGLLIGVGLGTVTVGVRVLLGQDRSLRG